MASSPLSFVGAAAAQRRSHQRQLVRDYKDNPPPMGVYAVRCTADGYAYLNAAAHVNGALNRDRFQLRMGGHPDRRLQQAWRAHGEDAFRFDVVDVLKRRDDAPPGTDYRAELAALLALWKEEGAA